MLGDLLTWYCWNVALGRREHDKTLHAPHCSFSLALTGMKESPGVAQHWGWSSPVRQLERREREARWATICSALCHIHDRFLTARLVKRPDVTYFAAVSRGHVREAAELFQFMVGLCPNSGKTLLLFRNAQMHSRPAAFKIQASESQHSGMKARCRFLYSKSQCLVLAETQTSASPCSAAVQLITGGRPL